MSGDPGQGRQRGPDGRGWPRSPDQSSSLSMISAASGSAATNYPGKFRRPSACGNTGWGSPGSSRASLRSSGRGGRQGRLMRVYSNASGNTAFFVGQVLPDDERYHRSETVSEPSATTLFTAARMGRHHDHQRETIPWPSMRSIRRQRHLAAMVRQHRRGASGRHLTCTEGLYDPKPGKPPRRRNSSPGHGVHPEIETCAPRSAHRSIGRHEEQGLAAKRSRPSAIPTSSHRDGARGPPGDRGGKETGTLFCDADH